MKIIVEFPSYIVEKIRVLVERGEFASLSDFLLLSAENQLLIEETDSHKAGSHSVLRNFPINDPQDVQTGNQGETSLELVTISQATLPTLKGTDDWIWGQLNRILPIKYAARLLAVKMSHTGEAHPLRKFAEYASGMARGFGLTLSYKDKALNKNKDDRLSIGFPIGSKTEASLNRYSSQFVGYRRKDGNLSGALFELALAGIVTRENVDAIELSAEGAQFAALENPVLDANEYGESLSAAEKEYYLNHIKSNVPGEILAFTTILRLISRGVDSRVDLDNEIISELGGNWTANFASTQRAGALSRMYELSLIRKEKSGSKVKYLPTETGLNWLEGFK